MKKFIIVLLLLAFGFNFAQNRPKLVIGIVVDQMKQEYLYRFSDDFSENGFKRLQNQGFAYHNMHYNYMPTYTAPGHASIFTGTTPALHGIVGNDWYNKSIGKTMYCTDDDSVTLIGNGKESEGKMSPKNLQSTTITDELKLSTSFKGKVIGISMKDRGAILPAGHFADWAFWYSGTGSFVSSTFYGEKLPTWVNEFNDEKHYETYLSKKWKLLKPKETYNESLNDDNPYEGKLFKKMPFFPYDLNEMYKNNDAGVLRTSPFGNSLVADFAKKAIEKEQLGKDAITDFLTVSFSATDYIGHTLGPRSIELQDTYLRLDETIADFLNYLDKSVGKGNYLVFLTADHAGAENATYLKDNKYNVDAVSYRTIEKELKEFSVAKFGVDVIQTYDNFNVFLNHSEIEKSNLEITDVKNKIKAYLYTKAFVKQVFTEDEILSPAYSNHYLQLVAQGYDPVQNGELIILEKPGYLEYGSTGTTHGSPYSYDTHVPMLFYGWNIKKGASYDKKVITQIAPTLAFKLKITLPNSTQAQVLEEILE